MLKIFVLDKTISFRPSEKVSHPHLLVLTIVKQPFGGMPYFTSQDTLLPP